MAEQEMTEKLAALEAQNKELTEKVTRSSGQQARFDKLRASLGVKTDDEAFAAIETLKVSKAGKPGASNIDDAGDDVAFDEPEPERPKRDDKKYLKRDAEGDAVFDDEAFSTDTIDFLDKRADWRERKREYARALGDVNAAVEALDVPAEAKDDAELAEFYRTHVRGEAFALSDGRPTTASVKEAAAKVQATLEKMVAKKLAAVEAAAEEARKKEPNLGTSGGSPTTTTRPAPKKKPGSDATPEEVADYIVSSTG